MVWDKKGDIWDKQLPLWDKQKDIWDKQKDLCNKQGDIWDKQKDLCNKQGDIWDKQKHNTYEINKEEMTNQQINLNKRVNIKHDDMDDEEKKMDQQTNSNKRQYIDPFDNNIYPNPTMEIISNKTILNMEQNINRYQRISKIFNIKGFVVNIHDAANFDIDFNFNSELSTKYQNVITNQYIYQNYSMDLISDFKKIRIEPKSSITYRCRLRGIGINQKNTTNTINGNKLMKKYVEQLINRVDGWIVCVLSDIDVYQRLLVDIIINVKSGPINLKEYILEKCSKDEYPLFYEYERGTNKPRTKIPFDKIPIYKNTHY